MRKFWLAIIALLLIPMVSYGQADGVEIRLVPATLTVQVDQTFSVAVYLYGTIAEIDAVDTELFFDPRYLEVENLISGTWGLTMFSDVAIDAGTVIHCRAFGESSNNMLRMYTVRFKAKAITAQTLLWFSDLTGAYTNGLQVLQNHSGGRIEIVEQAVPQEPFAQLLGLLQGLMAMLNALAR